MQMIRGELLIISMQFSSKNATNSSFFCLRGIFIPITAYHLYHLPDFKEQKKTHDVT